MIDITLIAVVWTGCGINKKKLFIKLNINIFIKLFMPNISYPNMIMPSPINIKNLILSLKSLASLQDRYQTGS